MVACQTACDNCDACKVFSWDQDQSICNLFNDYRSVTGYGGSSDHYIDNFLPSTRTYVKPFAQNDYITPWAPAGKMGAQQFATLLGAAVINVGPYQTMNNVDCRAACQNDPKCQGAFTFGQSCNLYDNTLDVNSDIEDATSLYNGYVKIKSTL